MIDFNLTDDYLTEVEGSKTDLIKLCNKIIIAAHKTEDKWEKVRDKIDSDWIGAYSDAALHSCGFCKEFTSCSECPVQKGCKQLTPLLISDKITDKDSFLALANEILEKLVQIRREARIYREEMIMNIIGN